MENDNGVIDCDSLISPLTGLNEKYLLKRVFQEIVPKKIVGRPKHPYRAPIRESLLHASALHREKYLSESALAKTGLFDPAKVQALLSKLHSVKQAGEVEGMALAGILSSQIVYDQFIANFSSALQSTTSPDIVFDRRSGKEAKPK